MRTETKLAIEIAQEVGAQLEHYSNTPVESRAKESGVHADIVTDIDIKIEGYIVSRIRTSFPTHGILSEETNFSVDPKEHRHLWVIDPIDGTICFSAGLPAYSVSISYYTDCKPMSSALYLASTKEVLWCETGKGAFVGASPIRIRDMPVKESIIALDQGVRTRAETMRAIAAELSIGIRALLMIPGEAGNLGLVARGTIQGLICSHPQIWDYAAGIHLVREAGGIVTDYAGNPYDTLSRKGHVVCTPGVHSYILEYTKKIAAHFS